MEREGNAVSMLLLWQGCTAEEDDCRARTRRYRWPKTSRGGERLRQPAFHSRKNINVRHKSSRHDIVPALPAPPPHPCFCDLVFVRIPLPCHCPDYFCGVTYLASYPRSAVPGAVSKTTKRQAQREGTAVRFGIGLLVYSL